MTSFRIEHLEPGSTRATRAVRFTRERAQDQLAGRTVWCGMETPSTSATRALEVPVDEGLCELADRLDAALFGASGNVRLGAAERALCEHAADIVAVRVARDDIVLLHDSVSTLLAMAIREHGAHTVWIMSAGSAAPRHRSPSSLPAFISAFDAFITTWRQGVAAALPGSDAVTVKAGPDAELDWNSALADVVDGDRQEMVGGTHHARPAVAPR
jgi:hypothetical protein